MLKRNLATTTAAVAACLITSCRSCVDKGPARILDVPSGRCSAIALVPSLEKLATGIDDFTTRATKLAGRRAAERFRTGLSAQLGFDPFVPEAYKQAGINAQAEVIAFVEPGHRQGILGFVIANRDAFDAALKTFVAKTDGASKHTTTSHHGRKVQTLNRAFGTESIPVVHWVHVGRFVLVTLADGQSSLLETLARLSANNTEGAGSSTLRADPVFAGIRGKVPQGEILLFGRSATPREKAVDKNAESSSPAASPAAIGSMRIRGAGLSSDVFLAVDGVDMKTALDADAPLSLASHINSDAVAVLLTRAANEKALAVLRSHPLAQRFADRAIAPLAQTTGLNVERDVLPLLAGPLTAGLHVGDLSSLLRGHGRRIGMRRGLEALHMSVTAQVRDPAAMAALLRRSQQTLAAQGIAIRERRKKIGANDAVIYEPDRETPQVGWSLYGDHYVWGGGRGRLERTLALLAEGGSELPKQLGSGVGGALATEPGSTVFIVRTDEIAKAASKITLGKGIAGKIGAAALFGSAIQVVRTLGDVAVRVRGDVGGLRVELREQMQ